MFTEADVLDTLCNPIYAGVFPYPAIVSREQWIDAAKRMVAEDGLAEFLQRMLRVLDESMQMAAGVFEGG
jgi:hypothetical protein